MTKNVFLVLEEERGGGFSVSVPALPGCFSQGDSFDEAVKNGKEAIALYLENEKSAKSFIPKNEVIVPVQIGL